MPDVTVARTHGTYFVRLPGQRLYQTNRRSQAMRIARRVAKGGKVRVIEK